MEGEGLCLSNLAGRSFFLLLGFSSVILLEGGDVLLFVHLKSRADRRSVRTWWQYLGTAGRSGSADQSFCFAEQFGQLDCLDLDGGQCSRSTQRHKWEEDRVFVFRVVRIGSLELVPWVTRGLWLI